MTLSPTYQQRQFHRKKIVQAQRFIRKHHQSDISLDDISSAAASSPFHFSRIFLSYTNETVFSFLRRVRVLKSLKLLQDYPDMSITDIGANVGYETSSAFNKVFKKVTNKSPSEFRNLGKEQQARLIYLISRPNLKKDTIMTFNTNYDIVTRKESHFVYFEDKGPFQEIAAPLWQKLIPLLPSIKQDLIEEYVGMGIINTDNTGEEIMIYHAGLIVKENAKSSILETNKELKYRAVPSGKYAKFIHIGPYPLIWEAFNRSFQTLIEQKVALRKEYAIENYLNDPAVTPENELLTEILIPIE